MYRFGASDLKARGEIRSRSDDLTRPNDSEAGAFLEICSQLGKCAFQSRGADPTPSTNSSLEHLTQCRDGLGVNEIAYSYTYTFRVGL